jgi:hypothetical protein
MSGYYLILALAVTLLAAGCTSPGAVPISGRFVHKETGTAALFKPNGSFYYSFTQPPAPTDKQPGWLGFYHFENLTNTTPGLTVHSADVMQFTLRFAVSFDRFYLSYPWLFQGERVYERESE